MALNKVLFQSKLELTTEQVVNSSNMIILSTFQEDVHDLNKLTKDFSPSITIIYDASDHSIIKKSLVKNLNPSAIPKKYRIFSLGLKEAFCRYSINISNCRCKRKFSKCQAHSDFIVCTSSVFFRNLANEHDFWNCFTFLKQHQISSRSLKESFSGNCEKIFECRAFSPFEILPGCRAFRHSVICNIHLLDPYKLS